MKKIFLALCLLTITLSVSAKRAPIVFIHGIIAIPQLYKQPFSMKRVLARRGYETCIVNNKGIGTIEESVAQAVKDIRLCLPKGGPFHLLGHSQGGLAARILAHLPEFKGRIQSITTLSAPHHGSMLADRLLPHVLNRTKKMPAWMQEIFEKFFGNSVEMVTQLTVQNMRNKFNPATPDVFDIRYFSYGHYIPKPLWLHASVPVLIYMHEWMEDQGEGDSDGFVGLASTRWGEYMGDFPGDHIAETFPAPMAGKFIVYDVLDRVTENLDGNFK